MAISGVPKRYFRQIFDTNAIVALAIVPPIKLCCYIVHKPSNLNNPIKAFGGILQDYLQNLDAH